MSEPTVQRLGRRLSAGQYLSSFLAVLAFVASALLYACGDVSAAEGESEDNAPDANSSPLTAELDVDTEQDDPQPLAFKPLVPKALTPADMPPPNLFVNTFPHPMGDAFGRAWRDGTNKYRAIIEHAAITYGLPPALLDAVMAVESRYNPAAVGMDGEVGLMQVMPATARMLGFTGTQAQLAETETNINYGAKYLAGAWRLAGQDICTAAMKYRAGHGETRFSYLSVDYCMRIRNHLRASGVEVTGSVPQPTFGASAGVRSRGRAVAGRGGGADLMALNERLRALTEKIAPRKFP